MVRPLDTAVLNQIRKWKLVFDGKDPQSFLEGVEEHCNADGIPEDQILYVLSELLSGEPLSWFRNNKTEWTTWKEFVIAFKEYFLPTRYQAKLKKEIYDRKQLPSESCTQYMTALQTLMRRAGMTSSAERLDLLYDNLRPELQLHIRRSELTSERELLLRAKEIEGILDQISTNGSRPSEGAAASSAAAPSDGFESLSFLGTAMSTAVSPVAGPLLFKGVVYALRVLTRSQTHAVHPRCSP